MQNENPWIETSTHKQAYLLNPETSVIDTHDIINALSKIPRYNGQTKSIYTVGQHTLLVLKLALKDTHPSLHTQVGRHSLLHDASEAYLGDMTSPLKSLFPEYRELEHRWETKIFQHFEVDDPFRTCLRIKHADLLARRIEAEVLGFRYLMWDGLPSIPEDSWIRKTGLFYYAIPWELSYVSHALYETFQEYGLY